MKTNRLLEKAFKLTENQTNTKRELLAGTVSYFTIVYIMIVNAMILAEAGIPLEAAVTATVLLSAASCLLMGFWANMPIILVPGMGVNALFAYTMVQTMGLTWQSALGAVFLSGAIFVVIAFTPFARIINEAIPDSLKEAISIGLGLFLLLLGLEKGGLVVSGSSSILAMGHLNDPEVLVMVLTLLLAIGLFLKNVPGNFLLTIVGGTLLAFCFGTLDVTGINFSGVDMGSYSDVFAAFSFADINQLNFWMAVFAMTMVLVFENIGLVHGHVSSVNRPDKYRKALQATSISTMLSGLFGSSPTVATVETAAGIASGGRTGLTAVVTGVLFGLSIFLLPIIQIIPDSAIAPILIMIGLLMLGNIRNLNLNDLSESIPALMTIAMIPLTYSIADGMAFGFILYPFIQVVLGKGKQVSVPMYLIGLLFLAYLSFSFIS